ncbi:hypothetical protein NMG60_11007813 [Bertholletia excelsa]
MVFKKLVSFLWSLVALRGRGRIKDSSSSSYEAVTSDLVGIVEAGPIESPGGSGVGGALRSELCCVCLSRLKEGEKKRVLPCQHEFHGSCIERWFGLCRKTCPLCRFLVEDEGMPRGKEAFTEEMVIWFSLVCY